MKIIIDIPDEFYKHTCETGFLVSSPSRYLMTMSELTNAIKNGTPLPKHHGRLISEEDMLSVIMFSKLFDDAKVGEVKEALLNIPTIIKGE